MWAIMAGMGTLGHALFALQSKVPCLLEKHVHCSRIAIAIAHECEQVWSNNSVKLIHNISFRVIMS